MSPAVLLIDDEPAAQFAIGEYFRQHGVEIDQANDASSARQRIAARTYRLIVADLILSPTQIDPLEVVSEIRRAQPSSRLVVLTGCGELEVKRRALELGAFAYVQKPVQLANLLDLALRALQEATHE